MNLFSILLLAIIVEGIVAYLNMFVQSEIKYQMIITAVLGVAVALAYQLDVLAYFGVTSVVPFIGNILTGMLLSRGSNYLADFVKIIWKVKEADRGVF